MEDFFLHSFIVQFFVRKKKLNDEEKTEYIKVMRRKTHIMYIKAAWRLVFHRCAHIKNRENFPPSFLLSSFYTFRILFLNF